MPRPRRPGRRLFYGWIIVGVLALGGLVQTGQFNPTLGVFIRPVTEEFGWSRSTFVGAHTIGTILGGVTALAVGPALDRFGPRWIMSVGFLLIGGALVGTAFVTSLWQFYLFMIAGRVVVQGAVALGLHVTVAKWFVQKRGQAMALANMGSRFGNGVTPLYAQTIVTLDGWRTSMLSLGLITWAVALLPSVLFLRRQPEDLGLRPDGASGPSPGSAQAAGTVLEDVSFTLKEALRTRAFHALVFVMCASMLIGGGVNLSVLAYLADRGIPEGSAVLVITAWSFMATAGTGIAGLLADRFQSRYILSAAFAGAAAGVLVLSLTASLPVAYLFVVVFGIPFGIMTTVSQVIFPNYFGRAHIGAIRGFTMPFMMLANAVGPLIASVAFDVAGTYQTVFWAFSALFVVCAAGIFLAPPPVRRTTRAYS